MRNCAFSGWKFVETSENPLNAFYSATILIDFPKRKIKRKDDDDDDSPLRKALILIFTCSVDHDSLRLKTASICLVF